jgi:hypothetical protein
MYLELQGNEPGLAAYYNFNNTTKDISGNGNDGYLMYKEEFVADPIVAPDSDSDGISDLEERGFDGTNPAFDGNGDGIPDWKQSKAASFKSFRKSRYITLASSATGKIDIPLVNVTPIEVPSGLPNGFDFPYDLVEYSLELPAGVNTAEVNFYPHGDAVYDTYMNFGPLGSLANPEWYNFKLENNTGATFATNIINLKFVDGQRGDHDLQANGTIFTVGGPAKSPEGLNDLASGKRLLRIYGNPSNESVRISFYAEKECHVSIKLYNTESKLVAIVFEGEATFGENSCQYNLQKIASGVYHCQLEMNEKLLHEKLVVAH